MLERPCVTPVGASLPPRRWFFWNRKSASTQVDQACEQLLRFRNLLSAIKIVIITIIGVNRFQQHFLKGAQRALEWIKLVREQFFVCLETCSVYTFNTSNLSAQNSSFNIRFVYMHNQYDTKLRNDKDLCLFLGLKFKGVFDDQNKKVHRNPGRSNDIAQHFMSISCSYWPKVGPQCHENSVVQTFIIYSCVAIIVNYLGEGILNERFFHIWVKARQRCCFSCFLLRFSSSEHFWEKRC